MGKNKGNIWDSKEYAHLGYRGKDSAHPLYSTYRRMIEATTLVSDKAYSTNKSRDVKVCDEWIGSFPSFVLDMGNRPSASHYMSRVNKHRSYDKNNCIWVKRKVKGEVDRSRDKPKNSGVPSMY